MARSNWEGSGLVPAPLLRHCPVGCPLTVTPYAILYIMFHHRFVKKSIIQRGVGIHGYFRRRAVCVVLWCRGHHLLVGPVPSCPPSRVLRPTATPPRLDPSMVLEPLCTWVQSPGRCHPWCSEQSWAFCVLCSGCRLHLCWGCLGLLTDLKRRYMVDMLGWKKTHKQNANTQPCFWFLRENGR